MRDVIGVAHGVEIIPNVQQAHPIFVVRHVKELTVLTGYRGEPFVAGL
jgi:hypothetical protein